MSSPEWKNQVRITKRPGFVSFAYVKERVKKKEEKQNCKNRAQN